MLAPRTYVCNPSKILVKYRKEMATGAVRLRPFTVTARRAERLHRGKRRRRPRSRPDGPESRPVHKNRKSDNAPPPPGFETEICGQVAAYVLYTIRIVSYGYRGTDKPSPEKRDTPLGKKSIYYKLRRILRTYAYAHRSRGFPFYLGARTIRRRRNNNNCHYHPGRESE